MSFSKNNWPIFTHETTANLEPVVIIASLNVEQILVDKLQFFIDINKEFHIGRNPLADIDIKHPAISRNHCIISFCDNKAILKNMSSVGIHVNKKLMRDKYDTHFLKSGDEILLSSSLPELALKFYENVSHITPAVSNMLKQNTRLVDKKRKMLLDSEQNVIAKKVKQDIQKKEKRQQLSQEKALLDETYSERLSIAQHNYDSQVLDVTSEEARHHYSAKDIKKKAEELRLQFNEEKNNIEADYALQLKKWQVKCLEMEENCEELKAENEKLTIQISAEERKSEELTRKLQELERLQNETQELKSKLKLAEEVIKMGKEELDKENKDKQDILEQTKQLEKMKQEALKKCILEKEAMKRELVAKYESEIQALHVSQIELEKKIVLNQCEKNTESESIINQLNDELDSVRQLLSMHETERQMLESEVQTKIKDFAEVLESEAQCTICSEIFVDAVTLIGCFHTFCQFCITEWKKQKQECPICRHKILKNQEKRNFTLDSWIKSFIVKMSPAMKSAREELIKIRSQQKALSVLNTEASRSRLATSTLPIRPGVRQAVVQGTFPRGSNMVLHIRPYALPQARGGSRRQGREVQYFPPVDIAGLAPVPTPAPAPAAASTFSLNALASEFQPLSESVRTNILNNVPIYVAGDTEPPTRPIPNIDPVNANPILISDEEDS